MGIKSATFTFKDGKGSMSYENRTGNHVLEFGFGSHIAGFFPETHYDGAQIGVPLARGYKIVNRRLGRPGNAAHCGFIRLTIIWAR